MWISKSARSAVTILNYSSRIAGIIGIVFLIAMMLLTVTDVFLRYFFNRPVMGSVELTEYIMVVAGFMGIAWCAVGRGHVKVDLIVGRFSPKVQAVVDSITYIFALGVVPLVAWQNFAQARYAKMEHVVSDLLEIPAYPFYIVVGVAYSLLALVLVNLLVESILEAVKK